MSAHHQIADFRHVPQERACYDTEGRISLLKAAAFQLGVGDLKGARDFHRRQAVGRDPFHVEVDMQHAALSAVKLDVSRVGNALKPGDDLFADAIEGGVRRTGRCTAPR